MVQSHLIRQYWIARGKNSIRWIVNPRVRCARNKARPLNQQKGSVPLDGLRHA